MLPTNRLAFLFRGGGRSPIVPFLISYECVRCLSCFLAPEGRRHEKLAPYRIADQLSRGDPRGKAIGLAGRRCGSERRGSNMKRILSLIMSVMITVSSLSCVNVTTVYADTIAGNYVSMGVMISLLFSAYGIQRTIEGSQYINNLIQQCAQEATETGFGMLKNGIQSIGVTIQNGVSYVQKSFAEFVYNWALEKNIFDVSSTETPEYFTFQEGTYTLQSGLTITQLQSVIGFPNTVTEEVIVSDRINSSYPCYAEESISGSHGQNHQFYFITLPIGTEISFTGQESPVSVSNYDGVTISYNSDSGSLGSIRNVSRRIYNSGQRTSNLTVYNGLNATLTGSLDYGVTNDIPDVSEDLDSYASDWVQDGITVDQDGTSEDYIPVTLPIDGVGTAVGVVEGTGEAINTAGAMDQYDVRSGAISDDAISDLQEAVQDSEAEEELTEDLSIHGLETVFPFCLPWDFASFVGLLKADPVAPRFELQALNADGETISYTFDLSMFDSVALVCRNMELLAFIITLILITKGFFV